MNVSPHGLPRTFASRLAMAGVDPRTIQGLGGWPSRTSRARPANANAFPCRCHRLHRYWSHLGRWCWTRSRP
ncbi:MAG: hypothetical protein DMD97_19610 [Candidatus Rokuibacteriota bacterium]|nr:MAG: hypothetical protein DMD97_19610 [Candidatus Rokubacteria bacterium]